MKLNLTSMHRLLLAVAIALTWTQLGLSQGIPTYTLDIEQPEHGAIHISPEMETYPRGTEITLTATPQEGYRFIDWSIVRAGNGNENQRGGTEVENPHTFMVNQDTSIRALVVGTITPSVHYDNLAVRGDDPNGSGATLKSTFDRNPQHPNYPTKVAQRFRIESVENVTAVELGLMRIGSPGGRLIVSVREVDENSDEPGNVVGILGEIDGNAVPEFGGWCSLPLKLKTVRVEGRVDGLEVGKDYFIHVMESEDDLPQANGSGCSRTTLVIDTVGRGSAGESGDGALTIFDWPWAPFAPGEWGPFDPSNNHTMRFRIEGSPMREPKPLQVDIEQAVAISWDSQTDRVYQIHSSTDMATWEIAVDAIEGTGERLTQCFIRDEKEVFYRVDETP